MQQSRHTLYVVKGESNSEKALQLLELLDAVQVDVVDVRDVGDDLPAFLKGVPTLYNGRTGEPAAGTQCLEQLIDEDDIAIELANQSSKSTTSLNTVAAAASHTTVPPGAASHHTNLNSVPTKKARGTLLSTPGKSKPGVKFAAANIASVAPGAADCGDQEAYMKRREAAMKAALAKREATGDPFSK